MMPYALTPNELRHLEITERVASCFSLVGTSFILFTFICSPAFRKPVNRLIFYASWGYVHFPILSAALVLLPPHLGLHLGLMPRAFPRHKHTDHHTVDRNTLCNVATLISQSGVRAGKDSHLCQFQGFLIQM